ncbi:hypothetical protein FHG66_12920 [Rubellimicrobium rubrum]|uniref:Uncharacterized protein n=1 Tax=Rubellimicrobium rubrum TaxID=2585369 RepID=A0A5C4MXP2_9RHOB|nr:hypothetical protein [Rubellimicrobium rubrum]TNC48717.1 hypothetical protein FHG66_12920 [Rubellimicrobium rubrum]
MPADHPEALIEETLAGPFGKLPMAGMLREHGSRFMGAALPATYKRGMPRRCFRNAAQLTRSRHLEYWEGWAWVPSFGALPFDHAWCVDPQSGCVVDSTWENPADCVYLGLHVPTEVLLEARRETGVWGVLDVRRGRMADALKRYLSQLPLRDETLGQEMSLSA